MFASFSMAFYRASVCVPSLITNVCNKFTVNGVKLHLSRRQLGTKSKQSSQRRGRNATFSEGSQCEAHNLSEYIQWRKFEAQRSIVVQVASWKSCKNLLLHCSQFGQIEKAFFYVIPKEHQFILLEYKSFASAQNALNAATYVDKANIVPTRTNVMWFRQLSTKGLANEIMKESKTTPYINSCNYTLLKESNIKILLANASSISSQMMIVYNEYRMQELEIRLKFQIIANIEQYFSGIFPNLIVHPFGSFINGFGKRLSDLDVVLFPDGLQKEKASSKLVFHTKLANINEKQQTHEFMGVLADTMKYMVPGIIRVRKIFNARVPIIKFNNVFTHTECDLSMNNVIATYMTELLYLYGELDNRVRPLVFTIRKWAKDNKLTSVHPGKTITNFSLTLLVIFYLQQEKILPPINKMEGFEEINGLDDKFLDHVYLHRIRPHWLNPKVDENLSNLLIKFFKYYSTFNFSEREICLREGFSFEKSENQPLYIRNPFERKLNVSKNVSENEIERMKSLMTIALSNLQNTKARKSRNWGILSLFNFPELPSINVDVSRVLEKDDEEGVPENDVILENSKTIENIEKSDINNALSAETQGKVL